MRIAGALLATCAIAAAVGATVHHFSSRFTRPDSSERQASRSPDPQETYYLDPEFFYDGSIICTRDLEFLREEGLRTLDGLNNPLHRARVENLIRLIDQARAASPQAVLFQCALTPQSVSLKPYDWSPSYPDRRTYSSQFVIVGAELPSLTTAVDIADRGYSITVVYAGPLGGISADTGANVRIFDNTEPTSHPRSELKLFRRALGMSNFDTIPEHTETRLANFFQEYYKGRVTFVKTHSYDSLNVAMAGGRLAKIVTAEGVSVSGQYFIDTDPESRIAEKCGIHMNVDTPDLSYGVVFDVGGMTAADKAALVSHELITPERLMNNAGVTFDQVERSHRALSSYHKLVKYLSKSYVLRRDDYDLRYTALAQAFDFSRQCQGLADPGDRQLNLLNKHRAMSGYNVSDSGSVLTFNSVSYHFPKTIMQYSKSLQDSYFDMIRAVDMPALTAFFRYVTGDPELRLRLPSELYVRKSTAFFRMLAPYRRDEFNTDLYGKYYTRYPMDLRDVNERDAYDLKIVDDYIRISRGERIWSCRASATFTAVPNLFLINKDAVTPAFSGGQRILGNQINLGAALIDSLTGTKQTRPPRADVQVSSL